VYRTIPQEDFAPSAPDFGAVGVGRLGATLAIPRPALRAAWWGLALLPFLLLVLLPRMAGPGVEGDDFAQYLMHAQALATGHAYGDILYIHSRLNPWIGPEVALPGLPVLLAPVLRLGGVAAVPWVMLAIALAFLALAGRYLARTEPPQLALTAVLIAGLTAGIVFNAAQPLTDLPLAAVIWGIALVADRPGHVGLARGLALTALVVAALLLRTAAVALVPALLATAFLRRRVGGWRLAVPVLVLAIIGAAALTVVDVSRVFLLRMSAPRVLGWMLNPHNMLHQARTYGGILLEAQLGGFLPAGPASLLRVLPLAVTVVGVADWMRRQPRSFGVVFTIVYGAMLVVLPFHHERYLWPLLPVLAYGLVNGARVIAGALGAASPMALGAAVAVGLAAALLGAAQTVSADRPTTFAESPEGGQLVQFLRRAAAGGPVRVTFAKPRMIAWTLKIPAMGAFNAPEDVTYRELCAHRITHVIITDLVAERDGELRHLTAARTDAFQPVFSNAAYHVYRYLRPCPAGAAPATASAR
jgi:hypothetical protein